MYIVFVLGPAGSGKSYLTKALVDWLRDQQLDAIAVNLDPAVEVTPYNPDVDIRDYITLQQVMKRFGLGPNGGLVLSIDLSVNYIDRIMSRINEYRPNYVVIDTPGQLEIFAFRNAGRIVIDAISELGKTVVLFLLDSQLITRPSSFISMALLAISTALRHGKPQITVLSKADNLTDEDIAKIMRWIEEPETVLESAKSEDLLLLKEIELVYALKDLLRNFLSEVIPVSSIEYQGLDMLYGAIQRIVAGGEDFLTEEPSERL